MEKLKELIINIRFEYAREIILIFWENHTEIAVYNTIYYLGIEILLEKIQRGMRH